MNDDIAIKVENLSKYYRLGVINNGTLFRDIQSWMARKRGKEDPHAKLGSKYDSTTEGFWALKDLNFEIKKGDRVGIIGHNGAGKSTLLKLLSQITSPTEGNIKINGRIASLLEVGTGFHPELTGRENIFMNGAILGMTHAEIDSKVDQIIEFSEIGEHIDTPVKRYSSGMYVRLAFAVAAHLDSEILIADEVLAVGDAAFQKKALGKMNELSSGQGRTVLFVSHNMAQVKNLCNKGIVLEHGKIVAYTDTIQDAINIYFSDINGKNNLFKWNFNENILNKDFIIKDFFLSFNKKDKILDALISNDKDFFVVTDFMINWKNFNSFRFGIVVFDESNSIVFTSEVTDENLILPQKNDTYMRSSVCIPAHFLNEGQYRIEITASSPAGWIYHPGVTVNPKFDIVIKGGLSDSIYWTSKRAGICAPILKWEII